MNVLHIVNGYIGNSLYKHFFTQLGTYNIAQSVFVPARKPGQVGINKPDNPEIKTYYPIIVNSFIYRLIFHLKIRKELRAIRSLVTVTDFSLIHAHTLFSDGAVAYYLFKQYKIPYIVAIRNTDINVFCKYFFHLRNLGREIILNSEKLVFLCDPYKEKLKLYYGSIAELIEHKSVIIPNGIDDFWYKNKPQVKTLSKDIRLVFAGQITYNKNIHTIIRAIEKLQGELVPELAIIGAGPNDQKWYLKWLEFMIKNKPLIKIKKAIPKEELAMFYKDATMFVMPSFKESFGLVYAEAISQNLPVLYTAKEGFDGWFYQGEVGYSVDPYSPADIAEKIILTVKNYDEIQHTIASKGEFFSWRAICEKYYQMYSNISRNN